MRGDKNKNLKNLPKELVKMICVYATKLSEYKLDIVKMVRDQGSIINIYPLHVIKSKSFNISKVLISIDMSDIKIYNHLYSQIHKHVQQYAIYYF